MNSIYQPCSLTGSTPSGSTNQTEFLDPMLARLSSPSGFGTDLLDFEIGAALAENIGPGNRGPHPNSDGLRFQSFTRTGTDLGSNENSTAAASDNNLENANPTGEGAESQEANPTQEREESDKRLTTLSEDEMLEMAEMELDALRDQEALHAQVKRLPAYLKAEVDELYYEFQRQLYLLAIKNRIYAALFYTHLGQINRMRGPTNYNNFCRFDPQAREIFNQKGIPVKQRCKEVAEKWQALTPKIKMKYKDYDFIKTLQGDAPVELVNGTIQTTRQVHVANTALNLGSNKKSIAFARRWIKDTIAEMNQLSASQGIQGMLIIASARLSGDLFVQGGTDLGRNFISMLRKGGDPIKKFQTYVAGMAAVEEVCGGNQVPTNVDEETNKRKSDAVEEPQDSESAKVASKYRIGPVRTNKKIIGAKMKELLNAAGGKYFKAWPGSNVVRDLNAASIQLKVKRNAADFHVKELCQPVNALLLDPSQRILQAIGEGWISLTYIEDGVDNSFIDEGTQPAQKKPRKQAQHVNRSHASQDQSSRPVSSSEEEQEEDIGDVGHGNDNADLGVIDDDGDNNGDSLPSD
ncbi:hypothetical protein MJO29_008674 [Puccinia striiformis f. sp. tritici]|uniref:hypothetical protein n=1 Tax=Puccinia striiformis f. sp. tritici TaxID=168172 RepID=UPI002008C769|nr:hypothetical protein Pst134EA_033504 [Puccinia striiformis f. sp. tritici]KAH9463075.1 hypothetical protein Pst134EA_033504 [Puccinia striiformis f. sp. tritici]KAI7953043.1 hypothetical protein MJO29_008674 [Puccinia striiformis f. sp. tritici]